MLQRNPENLVKTEQSQTELVKLPIEFDELIIEYPELKKLLQGLALRDPGTFLHCITVFLTGKQLLSDLFLRYEYPISFQKEVESYSPFFLLHDIGKTAAHRDQLAAQKRVHPVRGLTRTQEEMAFHWIHPQLSGTLLELYSQQISNKKLRAQLLSWAQLAQIHDEQLNPYLAKHPAVLENALSPRQITHLPLPLFLAMLTFLASDTAMAMALPRPNRATVWPRQKLLQIVTQILSKEDRIARIIPPQKRNSREIQQLKNYILASLVSSIQRMQSQFSAQQMMHPVEFKSKHFHANSKTESPNLELINQLIANAWDSTELDWLKTIFKMEQNGVFRYAS